MYVPQLNRARVSKHRSSPWLLTVGLDAGIIAEHLLNNKLQMSAFGATEGLVTLTKQMKMGLCEQVRVN